MAQTNDIEDVLSSIRRLVANESSPLHRARAKPEAAEGPTLVLSDSHRVTEPEDPFQMIRSLAQQERDNRDAETFTDVLPEEIMAITADLDRTDPPAEAWSKEDLDDAEPPLHLVTVPDDADDANSGDDDLSTEIDMAPSEDAQDPRLQDDDLSAVLNDAEEYSEDAYSEDADYEMEPSDQFSEGSTPATAKTAIEYKSANGDLADLSAGLEGDDALRDLISEIVRQELAGELGERITRNVRKLVRREVRQMLASDEFD